jgi:hypothetical protein
VAVASLGTSAETNRARWRRWTYWEQKKKVTWKQTAEGLSVELPKQNQSDVDYAAVLKVTLT